MTKCVSFDSFPQEVQSAFANWHARMTGCTAPKSRKALRDGFSYRFSMDGAEYVFEDLELDNMWVYTPKSDEVSLLMGSIMYADLIWGMTTSLGGLLVFVGGPPAPSPPYV